MYNDNELLNAEMAAISVVKSAELVDLVSDTNQLNKLQNSLDQSKDSVLDVQKILNSTEPADVTLPLADYVDRTLSRVGVLEVDGDAVKGVECLGLSLKPADYLKSRVNGCEGFLDSFVDDSAFIIKALASSIKDAFVILTETQTSLLSRLDDLQQDLAGAGKFPKGTEDLVLGVRLFNILQTGGKVENFIGQLEKVMKTINGLSTNYYINSKNNLNVIMSYFGGFDGIEEYQAKERFLMLPKSINSTRFKECNIPNRDYRIGNISVMNSVELMGGRFFIDSRLKQPNLNPKNVDDVGVYLEAHIENDRTYFNPRPAREYPDSNSYIKSLGSDEIKSIIKVLRDILKTWSVVYAEGDKHKMSSKEFTDIGDAILANDWEDKKFKHAVIAALGILVRTNQQELLEIRSNINTYLVYLVNGMVELCYMSLRANSQQ